MISFPWDSIVTEMKDGYPVYDRAYNAQQWREIYQTFFSDGVFVDDGDAFKVTPYNGMTVKVSPGRCNIKGTFGKEESERVLQLPAATSQDRIDTIVLRWDANLEARSIDLYVHQGVASATPVHPTLTRTESVWEIALCDVYVTKGATSISSIYLTDCRHDNERCGFVAPFEELDLKSFHDELMAQADEMVELAKSAIDGTTAGHLQNNIDSVVRSVEEIDDVTTTANYVRNSDTFFDGSHLALTDSITKLSIYNDGWVFWGASESAGNAIGFENEGMFTNFVYTGSKNTDGADTYAWANAINRGLQPNDRMTVSFEFNISNKTGIASGDLVELIIFEMLTRGLNGSTSTSMPSLVSFPLEGYTLSEITENKWYKASFTYTVPAAFNEEKSFICPRFTFSSRSGIIKIRKLCIQLGNYKNGDWSVSPLDFTDNIIKTRATSSGFDTVNPNSRKIVYLPLDTKANYEPLGIGQVTVGNEQLCISGFAIGSSNISIYLYNPTSMAQTFSNVTVHVIWCKVRE